jgi:hypothetical protein
MNPEASPANQNRFIGKQNIHTKIGWLMRTASDIADWWDRQHSISKQALDDFVDENPGVFGIVIATAVATAMDVGKGTVDVLRLGEGVAEGTAGGITQDVLRTLSIVGTVGKGAKIIKEVVSRSRMMKLIVDPGGGRCAYISSTQALRQTGQKAFASVEDLAKELGMSLDEMGGSNAGQIRAFMLKVKAAIGPSLKFKNWGDIERSVPRDGSVVSFGVNFAKGGAHRLYAFRDALGRVRIMDRGGSAGKLPEVLDSLEALAKKYGRGAVSSFNDGFAIKDLFLKFVGPKGAATLAMEVLGTTAFDPDAVTEAFESYKQTKQRLVAPTTTIVGGYPVEVSVSDPNRSSLSAIAKAQYGDFNLWPLIFDLNKEKIGTNPNRIKPGLKLLLLPLDRYTAAELADARRRAPSWRNYPL